MLPIKLSTDKSSIQKLNAVTARLVFSVLHKALQTTVFRDFLPLTKPKFKVQSFEIVNKSTFNPQVNLTLKLTTLKYQARADCPIMMHSLKQDYLSSYFIRMFCEKISGAEHFKVVLAGKFKIVTLSVCYVIPLFPL